MTSIKELKRLYEQGVNIMDYLRKERGVDANDSEIIQLSYDLQAGSYIKHAKENPEMTKRIGEEVYSVIQDLEGTSILEVGVGEARTLHSVLSAVDSNTFSEVFGIDISWSRVYVGLRYLEDSGFTNVQMSVGDLFSLPYLDSSIDIVYTFHSLEPNGGREKDALIELMRVAKKYVVLFEPDYDIADENGRARMLRMGYVKDLKLISEQLGYKVRLYKKFPYELNPLNPTSIIVLEKTTDSTQLDVGIYRCPVTGYPLQYDEGCWISSEGLVAYPIVKGIPCLIAQKGIIVSHYFSDLI